MGLECVGDQLARLNFRMDRFGAEFGEPHRADDAAPVAPRNHVDRQRFGDYHRIVQRFMAVAVDEGDVVADQLAAPHDLVHRGSAVQHVIGLVGAENPRRIPLGVADHALMVKQ